MLHHHQLMLHRFKSTGEIEGKRPRSHFCGLPRNGFRPHCPSAGFRSAILDSDKPVEADLVNNLTDSIQTRKPSQRKMLGREKEGPGVLCSREGREKGPCPSTAGSNNVGP